MTRLGAFLGALLGASLGLLAARVDASVPVDAPVLSALQKAVSVPAARIEVSAFAPDVPKGCLVDDAAVGRGIDGSARVAVKLAGQTRAGAACSGWAWAQVRVFAPVWVTTRALRDGDALSGATEQLEREIVAGRKSVQAPVGLIAARAIAPGSIVEDNATRAVGGRAGETIKVMVAVGALQIEQAGRISSACGRGRVCAVLPSGKHVEGALVQGRLLVTP